MVGIELGSRARGLASTGSLTPPNRAAFLEARVRSSDPTYGDILDFLNDEAALLDDDRFVDWLGCLAEDICRVVETAQRCA
jgi:hypothetical protein